MATVTALNAVLLNPPDNGASSIILDLSGVTFIDSSGLGAIVAAYQHGIQQGHAFNLAALSPGIARRFKTTSLDTLIPIQPTIDGIQPPS